MPGSLSARQPLRLEIVTQFEHIKPRLRGHWSTTPGLSFLYVHLNRPIKENNLNMIYVIGPGHGDPDLVAQTYLVGSIISTGRFNPPCAAFWGVNFIRTLG